MKWVTHIAIAFLFCKIVSILLQIEINYSAYAIIALFAVLADLDYFLNIEHRTYTHTLYFCLVSLVMLAISFEYFVFALTAMLSHLFADMMTVTGVKLFYPHKTVYHLLPTHLRLKTGYKEEFAILTVVILLTILISSSFEVSEKEKTFSLLREQAAACSVSLAERGGIERIDDAILVYDNVNNKVLVLTKVYGVYRSRTIDLKDILDIKVKKLYELDRHIRYTTVNLSLLREDYANKIIVKYEDDGEEYEFWGTGIDLYNFLGGIAKENELKFSAFNKTIDLSRLGIAYYEVKGI